MEAWRGLFCLTLLCVLLHVQGENADFDLADALDDPKPTKKPSSGVHPSPRPPNQPQPGNPNNGGRGGGGGMQPVNNSSGPGRVNKRRFPGIIYVRPGHPPLGNQQGNKTAKIVSPIVVVVSTLIGLVVRYYKQRSNSLRTNAEEGQVNMENHRTTAEPAVQQTLLEK